MNSFFVITLFAAVAVSLVHGSVLGKSSAKDDYFCQKDLCKHGHHVLCNAKMQFASRCHRAAVVPLTDVDRQQFLDAHNILRNMHAMGKDRYTKLPKVKVTTGEVYNTRELIDDKEHVYDDPASGMAPVSYDYVLERGALENVLQCAMDHDECRNSKRFIMAGQNLYTMSTLGVSTVPQLINGSTTAWYSEYSFVGKHLNPSPIDSYYSNPDPDHKKAWGHFTQVVRDDAYAIGCAIAKSRTKDNEEMLHYFVACNYAITNVEKHTIYRKGKAGSTCPEPNKMHPKYHALCSEGQDYSAAFIVVDVVDGKTKQVVERVHKPAFGPFDSVSPVQKWVADGKKGPAPMQGSKDPIMTPMTFKNEKEFKAVFADLPKAVQEKGTEFYTSAEMAPYTELPFDFSGVLFTYQKQLQAMSFKNKQDFDAHKASLFPQVKAMGEKFYTTKEYAPYGQFTFNFNNAPYTFNK